MRNSVLLGIALCLCYACSNDFEVTAPWDEVPVVYAIISPQDTATYIRVEKAFLSPERSALEVAKIADSLYYPENAIEVFLERDGAPNTRVKLTRVDGVAEGIVRAEGIFASQPNWLYKYKSNTGQFIEDGKRYKLTIKRADGGIDITAVTTVPGKITMTKPNESQTIDIVNFLPGPPTEIRWSCDENATLCNIDFIIRFREVDPTNGVILDRKELKYAGGRNILSTQNSLGNWRGSYALSGTTFYNFLRANIDSTVNVWRYFEKSTIIIEGGGKEINAALEAAQANAGVTGAEIINSYSNISEGFGIFTGKSRRVYDNLLIGSITVDSMDNNIITRKLNFKY
jgi:hypothetical protein